MMSKCKSFTGVMTRPGFLTRGLVVLAAAFAAGAAGCGSDGGPGPDDCEQGYEWDGTACVDTDECAAGTDTCAEGATCTNTDGSFTCVCSAGYTGDGTTCTDIDECTAGTDNCAADATCANTPGAFTCTCPSGYEGDGTSCRDIDECDDAGLFDCTENADCNNTDGSYTCVCKDGFDGDGVTCTDIDECTAGTDDCDENADCENTPGSYTCTCVEGWDGDGRVCNDVNECEDGTNDCDEHAECDNYVGAFGCACMAGWVGDGRFCNDIDECASETDECSDDAICENTVGSHTCTCKPGFDGDGSVCNDITHWLAVAYAGSGIGMVDTDTMVVHGPYLKGRLGSSGGGIFDVVVTPDGNTAIVSNFGDMRLYFVDITVPTAPVVLGNLQMPMFAEDIAISPDGKYALVTDGGFSPYIVSVDVQARAIVESKVQKDIFTNAVEIAPDGTVITANYFEGSISTFVLDAAGTLTYGDTYKFGVRLNGDASNEEGVHMVRPVNVAIAPDGKTVLVPDVSAYNTEGTALDPVPDKAGMLKFVIGVYQITSPGVLELKSVMSGIPRAVQSVAFDRTGNTAYLLGNGGRKIDRPEDFDGVLEEEMDNLMFADIESPGVVTFDNEHMVNLGHYSGSQLFGVDNLVVHRGRAYATYSTMSVFTTDMRTISVVDLETLAVSRLGVSGLINGIARVPVQTAAVTIPAGSMSCVGFCAEITDSQYYFAGGVNREQRCFCDDACTRFGDCCPDYVAVCGGCDKTACSGDFRCANTVAGTFECGCPTWTADQGGNVCALTDICGAEGGAELCKVGATCENDIDVGYRCVCAAPFVPDGSDGCQCPSGKRDDGAGGCADIDECAEELDNCNGLATCNNNDGGFSCDCPTEPAPGFFPDGFGGCVCPDGYEDDGTPACVDIDECAAATHECRDPAICANTVGGYQCNCPDGFGLVPDGMGGCRCPQGFEPDDDGICQDIDECAIETDNCIEPATCENAAGSFGCVCPEGSGMIHDPEDGCVCPTGTELDDFDVCQDIDECTLDVDNCAAPSECVNLLGGFSCDCSTFSEFSVYNGSGCECQYGFRDDGATCVDIDECAEWAPCGDLACFNYQGGYFCD